MFFMPDLWCGFLSISLLDGVARHLNPSSRVFASSGFSFTNGPGNFVPIYATTVVEGFILSFILLMISFFAVIYLQARESRRMDRRDAT